MNRSTLISYLPKGRAPICLGATGRGAHAASADGRAFGARPKASLGLLLLATFLVAACGDNQTFLPERPPYQAPDIQPLDCLPNLDGRIDESELGVAFDLPASFLISPAGEERAVDVAGRVDNTGRRSWDWGADFASDQALSVTVHKPNQRWYAPHFPNARFVACFDAGCRIEAIYQNDGGALLLLGVASAEENPPEGKTLLPYKSPVMLYRYPLQVGDQRVSVGEVENGVFRGLPYAGRDTYEISIDAAGELVLPQLTFTQALRVRTRTLLQPAAGQSTSQRQVSFFFECFGEVARATSALDEPAADFTRAIEMRRLGF